MSGSVSAASCSQNVMFQRQICSFIYSICVILHYNNHDVYMLESDIRYLRQRNSLPNIVYIVHANFHQQCPIDPPMKAQCLHANLIVCVIFHFFELHLFHRLFCSFISVVVGVTFQTFSGRPKIAHNVEGGTIAFNLLNVIRCQVQTS